MSDMFASTAIKNISQNLAKAVNDCKDIDAREKVAFASSMSGYVMCVGRCTSEHSLEHAMSAYHQELQHGAGLIMISKAYFTHLINRHICDERFIEMAKIMGIKDSKDPMDFIKALTQLQEDCGVANLKMSDYGIKPKEFETMAKNAKDTMGFLFNYDRCELSVADCVSIYNNSYK